MAQKFTTSHFNLQHITSLRLVSDVNLAENLTHEYLTAY